MQFEMAQVSCLLAVVKPLGLFNHLCDTTDKFPLTLHTALLF